MEKYDNVDELDLMIIALLMKDAKTPYSEIGGQLNVSGGTIHVRIKKLENLGIIKGSTLNIDYAKLGFSLTAFLGINLLTGKRHEEVVKGLNDISEIVELHYTTGIYHLFAKVICLNSDHLSDILINKISLIEGIDKTETIISLKGSTNSPINLFLQ